MMLKLFKISFSIMIIAMMLMLTFIWFRRNDAFVLKAAKIEGNCFLTKEEIFELAEINFSKDIFKVDTDRIKTRILSHPMIEKVSVTRFLPSALKITIKEANLIALISGSEVVAVDVTGTILSQYPMEAAYDLPVITGFDFQTDSTGIRKPNNPELVNQTVDLLNEIKSLDIVLYYEISEIHYGRNHGIIIYLKKSNLPVVLGDNDLKYKLIYFSTIYHHLIEKNKLDNTLAIDIRFKNQVVVKHKS